MIYTSDLPDANPELVNQPAFNQPACENEEITAASGSEGGSDDGSDGGSEGGSDDDGSTQQEPALRRSHKASQTNSKGKRKKANDGKRKGTFAQKLESGERQKQEERVLIDVRRRMLQPDSIPQQVRVLPVIVPDEDDEDDFKSPSYF